MVPYNATATEPTARRPRWSEGARQLVNCWTHMRRRFVKRQENDGSPTAEQAVHQIAQRYAIKASARGRAPETRLAARSKLAAPIVAAFRPWLEAQLSRIPQFPKPPEDIRYTLGIWPGLTRFLQGGRLELDTNPVENRSVRLACPLRSGPP